MKWGTFRGRGYGTRFLGGTFEKVPPITPSKLSKRKFWESNIGKVCAFPFCFAHWICQHVHRFSTRASCALGSRKRLGTTNPIRSESCLPMENDFARTVLPLTRHPERRERNARTESNFCGSREAAGVRASKSARRLRRSGIYVGLPIAFQRKCYILYRGRTLATKYNICLSRTNQTPYEIPASLRSLISPRYSLGEISTTLRMTHRGIYGANIKSIVTSLCSHAHPLCASS